MLPAGETVDLTLRARDPEDLTLDVYTGLQIVVERAEPVAHISGGSRSAPLGQSLEISAADTVDPDDPNQVFS
eukprot:COSAG06_NODE_15540_length_1063_cov_1.064315_1_plen_72_part_10